VGKVVASVPTGMLDEKEESVRNAPSVLEEGYSQSRIETAGHGLTRAGEGGLSGGVVFLMELEGNGVSRLSNNGVGLERENTSTTDDHTVVAASGGGLRIHNDWSGGQSGGRGGCWRYRDGRTTAHCRSFESGELVSWVHGEDHSLLAVTRLAAVHPSWRSIMDSELGNGEGSVYVRSGNRHATRPVSRGRFTSKRTLTILNQSLTPWAGKGWRKWTG
jgi:hypothetical protein